MQSLANALGSLCADAVACKDREGEMDMWERDQWMLVTVHVKIAQSACYLQDPIQ
jgi:hypothetical protein